MIRFNVVQGVVVSTPIIEMENPFYLSFHIDISGDVVPCTFIGDAARALKNNIKVGDTVQPTDGLIDKGRLVFDKMYMDVKAAKGRNLNVWG